MLEMGGQPGAGNATLIWSLPPNVLATLAEK